jgi:hypothetical protein
VLRLVSAGLPREGDHLVNSSPNPSTKECWLSFLTWLNGGALGILPGTLRLTLGPIWRLLPLARQVAEAISPWLLARLAERRRLSSPAAGIDQALSRRLAADLDTRPLRIVDVRPDLSWLGRKLEVELARLIRLIEAPHDLVTRPGWLPWLARY